MTLPRGTVTFLFSDIEGSTRLARSLAPEAWDRVLAAHDRLAVQAVGEHSGVVVKHEGDGVFAAFAEARAATRAALAFQAALKDDPVAGAAAVRVRIGLHTGDGRLTASGTDYVGVDVHYAARVAAAANGGQIVLSDTTRASIGDELPPDATLLDAGLVRVKDFEEPRRLHRLVSPGADDSRPLRTESGPSNLPESVSSFVGREVEVADVVDLLRRARLVTLTGPGGTGKTRLSLAVAERVRDEMPGGAWFVGLAPVFEPDLVPSVVATALGIEEEVGRPIAETVIASLRDRRALLVLDNFEQVADAAPFVTELLAAAGGIRVLVSSRTILRLAGEHEYRVPPLGGLDAVTLFVERARAVRPGFTVTDDTAATIAAICERLDDLPLAIELAAARTRLFTPAALLGRLERSLEVLTGGTRDVPERQRTLRATIAWSHDLLGDAERILFRRLAIFTGGWTIESAESVCDPAGSLEVPVLDGLASLVDESLVFEVQTDHGEPRFHRLVTIGEFALEQLAASGEQSELARRHAEHFVELGASAERELEYGDPGPWLDRLEHEQHNLRAALEWCLRADEPGLAMRLAGSVWRFWQHRSHLREGRDWCARILGRPEAARRSEGRFKTLIASGGLSYWLADYATTEACYEEALAIAESLDSDALRAEALYNLGFIDMVAGDTVRLRERHEASAGLFLALGDRQGFAKVRQGLVLVSFLERDWETARRLTEEDNAFLRETGARYRLADGETLLAVAALGMGDLDGATAHLRAAMEIEQDLDLTVSLIGSLLVAALIANAAGDPERGAQLGAAAALLREVTGSSAAPMDVLHLPDPAVASREALGEERFLLASEAGRRLSLAEAVALAGSMPDGAVTTGGDAGQRAAGASS